MDINNEGPIKGGAGGEGVVSLSICDMKFGPIFPKLVKFTQVNSFLKTIPTFWGQNNEFFWLENKHRCPRGSHPSHLDEKKEDEIQIEKLMWTRGNGRDLIQSPSLHIRFNFTILDETTNVNIIHPRNTFFHWLSKSLW
jgi:hypothetical protein